MDREERNGERLDRLERALAAAHRGGPPAPPLDVDAVMARVRAAGAAGGGDVRFLTRFLAAAAVAAVLLLGITLYDDTSRDVMALNALNDSSWTVLVPPSVLN